MRYTWQTCAHARAQTKARDLRLVPFLTCLCLILAAPLAQAQQPTEKADIVRLLGRMHEFVPIEEEFRALGFAGENLDLAMAQYKRVFNDPGIAGYVADRILATQQGTIPGAMQAGGLLGPLIDRGIGHLPTQELKYFYLVENEVFGALPYRECGLAVKQRLSDRRLADATARAAARLNTPALREYYRIQYKAARLGLTRDAKRLSPARNARIEKIIGDIVFSREGDARSQSLMRTFATPERATHRQACEAGRMIMDTVLSMEGNDLRDALIYFSTP